MQATTSDLKLVLRPYRPNEYAYLLPGMQSYEVLGHTSFRRAFTSAEAEAYLGRLEANREETAWAICLVEGDEERPVGTTSLEMLPGRSYMAESGIVIYDRSVWGRGIASLAHVARTKYAFEVMGLVAITSAADQNNHGSRRALERMGYCKTGVNYHAGVTYGVVVHADRFLLVNPAEGPWRFFWGSSSVPPEFVQARDVTRSVLAEAGISYL